MNTNTSRLLRESEGPDGIWRATWATEGGRLIDAKLDMMATARLARMKAGMREPDPNGHEQLTWRDRLWELWHGLLFGGPARW